MNDRQKINHQKVKHKHNESATQQLIFMGYNYSSLAETFEFSWSLFAEEHNTLPQSIRRNINIWNPMATRFLMHSCKHWFMSSLCNFCRWGANIAPGKMSWATRKKERRRLLQYSKQCCAAIQATFRRQQTPQLWREWCVKGNRLCFFPPKYAPFDDSNTKCSLWW